MRRVLSVLAVLVGLLSLLASPASAVEDATPKAIGVSTASSGDGSDTDIDQPAHPIYACSGYATLARHETAAGNVYSTQGNVCVYHLDYDPSRWGVVTRYKCYRNGQPYGEGVGGCRWTWNQAFQTSWTTASWETRVSEDWCDTCGGEFVFDSGRNFGRTYDLDGLRPIYVRGVSRSSATMADQVRFYLADGTTVLKNMSDRFSQVRYVL